MRLALSFASLRERSDGQASAECPQDGWEIGRHLDVAVSGVQGGTDCCCDCRRRSEPRLCTLSANFERSIRRCRCARYRVPTMNRDDVALPYDTVLIKSGPPLPAMRRAIAYDQAWRGGSCHPNRRLIFRRIDVEARWDLRMLGARLPSSSKWTCAAGSR